MSLDLDLLMMLSTWEAVSPFLLLESIIEEDKTHILANYRLVVVYIHSTSSTV